MEDWRVIDGYDGAYWVSDQGRVFSVKYLKPRELKPWKTRGGYPIVMLYRDSIGKKYTVHQLICETFLGARLGREVNHKNGIKTDNSVDNLEWCTRSDNSRHAFRVLGKTPPWLGKTGSEHPSSKRVIKMSRDGIPLDTFVSVIDAATKTGIERTCIQAVARGERKTAGGYMWMYV